MRTDPGRRSSTGRGLRLAASLLVGSAAVASALTAQVEFDESTQVSTVSFVIDGPPPVDEPTLVRHIATRGRGQTVELRRALSWVPLVAPVEDRLFDPVEVQKDKERIRRLMDTVGYPRASVEYEVDATEDNSVAVRFVIQPGAPLVVRSTLVSWSDAILRPDLVPEQALEGIEVGTDLRIDQPLDSRSIERAEAAVRGWLADQGHPSATVSAVIETDSARTRADVTFQIQSGPRQRIGSLTVEEDGGLRQEAIDRTIGIQSGDWYSRATLRRARQRLTNLPLVRDASFSIVPEPANDSTLDLVLRITADPQHTIGGQFGYGSDGGVSAVGQWSDRNLFGGGQVLTANLTGQSGWLALDQNPERFVRGSLGLRQSVFGGRLSLSVGPFAEYRDDYRDRSFQVGGNVTLLRRLGEVSSVALSYELSSRRIYEYRFADISAGINLLDLLQRGAEGVLDEFGARLNRSLLTLTLSIMELDSPTAPTRGFSIEPTASITVLPALNSNQFASINVRATGYLPLTGSIGLAARAGAGRLFPFGKSVPGLEENAGIRGYFRLREDLMTAGGSHDVRGWAERMLGPKFPTPILVVADSTVVLDSDSYSPIGGFNRLHGSVELRFPLGVAPERLGGHTFLDAGRIWTKDERFTSSDDPYGVERVFWATGVGFDLATSVGSLRVSVGYKLNPSFLDLVDPLDALEALLSGTPQDEWRLEEHGIRRFRVHIGFGTLM